jgi:prephenate dehydrogenase
MNAASDGFAPRTVAIHSVGLLGGSIGLALKHSGFTGTIVGLSSAKNLATARSLGCIDEGAAYEDLPAVVQRADLLFLCSPIQAIQTALRRLGGMDLPRGLVVTDVGSTKRSIVTTARQSLPPHVVFVGGHPMTGSERSGPSGADPFLYQNAVWVLAAEPGPVAAVPAALAAFLERYTGCRSLFVPPELHDTIAAAVSHVPHLLAVALVNLAGRTAERAEHTLDLAAGGFRDMTRIASAPYHMWHDIIVTNRDLIAAKLDEYAALLTEMRGRLLEGDLSADFERAAATRATVPSRAKGLAGPVCDVVVSAPDQPGAIAAIAAALSQASINIKDIEVLRVREGEGGTIRLAFDTPSTARRAIDILAAAGFGARMRE